MSKNPPAKMPDNPFTRMMEEMSWTVRAGAAASTQQARSASVGRPVHAPPPLTEAERAELDAKAHALGLMEDPQVTGVPTTAEIVGPAQEERIPVMAPSVPVARMPDFSKVQGIDLIRNLIFVDTLEIPLDPVLAQQLRRVALDSAVALVQQQILAAAEKLGINAGGAEDGTQAEGTEGSARDEVVPEVRESETSD